MARKRFVLKAEPEEQNNETTPETPVEPTPAEEVVPAQEEPAPAEPVAPTEEPQEPVEEPAPPAEEETPSEEPPVKDPRFFESFPCDKSGYVVQVMRRRRRS